MIDNFFRHLRHLQKADALIGRIWLNVLACQLGLFLFEGLIAIFGLGMTNVAGLYALQESLGPVWAAVVVAIADFALAAIEIWGPDTTSRAPKSYWPTTLARSPLKPFKRTRAI
jgi:hypothetical protein